MSGSPRFTRNLASALALRCGWRRWRRWWWREVVGHAGQQAPSLKLRRLVRAYEPRCGSRDCGAARGRQRPRVACEREGVSFVVDVARGEVPGLQADIDVAADRIINSRQKLPGKFAFALVEGMDVRIASAGADVAAHALLPAEIKEAIQHQRPRVHAVVEIEIVIEVSYCEGRQDQRVHHRPIEVEV